MRRASKIPSLEPPADKAITSLYVGGVEDPFVTQQDLQDYFYQFGEIRVINVLKKQKAAFVHFTRSVAPPLPDAPRLAVYPRGTECTLCANRGHSDGRVCLVVRSRPAAEKAAEAAHNKLVIKGRPLKVMWGRAQGQRAKSGGGEGGPALFGAAPGGAPALAATPFLPPPPPGVAAARYPSQDPFRMGARSAAPITGAHEKGQTK